MGFCSFARTTQIPSIKHESQANGKNPISSLRKKNSLAGKIRDERAIAETDITQTITLFNKWRRLSTGL